MDAHTVQPVPDHREAPKTSIESHHSAPTTQRTELLATVRALQDALAPETAGEVSDTVCLGSDSRQSPQLWYQCLRGGGKAGKNVLVTPQKYSKKKEQENRATIQTFSITNPALTFLGEQYWKS